MTAGAWEADLAFIRRSLESLASDVSWRVNGECDPNGVNFTGQSIAKSALERLASAFSNQCHLSEALEALKPFALTAEHDIGSTETDADIFQQMGQYNRAPKITVGDMRRAWSVLEDRKAALADAHSKNPPEAEHG